MTTTPSGTRERPGSRPWATGLSLRGRLLLTTMALLAAGLTVSGAVAVATLRAHLIGRVDQQLTAMAAVLSRIPARLTSVPSDRLSAQSLTAVPGMDLIDQVYVAYLSADGGVEQQSDRWLRDGPRDRGLALPRLDTTAVGRLGGRPFDATGSDGSRLTMVCAATAAALLTSLAVIGWFAVRRGLRPLRKIEETAAAVAGGDLSRRVPALAAPRTEVGRLAAALNVMLGQLEAAFAARERAQARMRRFVADVSHELRTPLFGIKGFAELHRMGGLPEAGLALDRIESEAGRLVRLVEDLLLLARLDESDKALPMDLAPMDLRTLAADAHNDLRALDPGREVTLTGPDGGPPGEAPVLGDEARLRQVVSNLVGNAVAHTPPGTPVRIGVGTAGDDGVLVIADEGPGMPAEEAARVFDRFYRVDGSRSRSGAGGAGLGLAIVRSIVTAHGGRVELRTRPGAGAAFRVVLPREGLPHHTT